MDFVSTANAADIPSTHTSASTPKLKIMCYVKIPERTHMYHASDQAKMIVQKSITIDTLFSGVCPTQWSSADTPDINLRVGTTASVSAIVEMRSLAAAIQDCRDKANVLDWAAWNSSYF